MTKAAILISAILLFAGVAAASSLTSLGGSDTPTLSTPTLGTTSTGQDDQGQAGDISGPCDEAEHANDPRCTGATGVQPRGNDDGDRHNRGPGDGEDNDDDSSGHRGGNSGPGGGGDDD